MTQFLSILYILFLLSSLTTSSITLSCLTVPLLDLPVALSIETIDLCFVGLARVGLVRFISQPFEQGAIKLVSVVVSSILDTMD